MDRKLPEEGEEVLLFCKRYNNNSFTDRPRSFVVQGKLVDDSKTLSKVNGKARQFWREEGYGLTFYDHDYRRIQGLGEKDSRDKVTHWDFLMEDPE